MNPIGAHLKTLGRSTSTAVATLLVFRPGSIRTCAERRDEQAEMEKKGRRAKKAILGRRVRKGKMETKDKWDSQDLKGRMDRRYWDAYDTRDTGMFFTNGRRENKPAF